MIEFKGCPVCGSPPAFREIVPGKVWGGDCTEPYRLHHSFSVMSWTSMEDCHARWNKRFGDEK